MGDPKPTRTQGDLAEMLDTVLDKGVVINADVAVSVGDTELLGVKIRAAVASFETAAEYGLEFPGGTDVERVREAAGVEKPPPRTDVGAATGIDVGDGGTADDADDADDAPADATADGAGRAGEDIGAGAADDDTGTATAPAPRADAGGPDAGTDAADDG